MVDVCGSNTRIGIEVNGNSSRLMDYPVVFAVLNAVIWNQFCFWGLPTCVDKQKKLCNMLASESEVQRWHCRTNGVPDCRPFRIDSY
jgi:hypothetical protein